MKNLIPAIFFILMSFSATTFCAEFTTGVGFGPLYSGFGANIGVVGDRSNYYLSGGCPLIGSSSKKVAGVCGVGISATYGLPIDPLHHHFVFYSGVTGGALRDTNGTSEREMEYGVGLGYVYYKDGSTKGGWNFGFIPSIGLYPRTRVGMLLNLGYQFVGK